MRPAVKVIILATAAIVAAHLGDSWAWHHLIKPGIYDHDMGRMFRTVGFLPVWLLLAIGLWLSTGSARKGWLLALVPTAGGALAEILKILLRRERPGLHDGAYYFRPFSDHLIATKDIGLPSSHALVAFSAAWLLCRLYPRGWPVWLFLAAACAVTRVQAQAHFLSDVTVAAVAAWFLVAWVWPRWGVASHSAE
ncbi:MAG: phosphatase PAP2 family protein [Gemmatimonadota bacterium]